MALRRRCRYPFHRPVMRHDRFSEAREPCISAARAAHLRKDDRLIEHLVELIDEHPCSPIGHAEGASRGGNRARCRYALEQLHFAGADALIIREIYSYAQLGQRRRSLLRLLLTPAWRKSAAVSLPSRLSDFAS
jgi:hypothetical protein